MRGKSRTSTVLRRLMRYLYVGLMYCGTHAWPTGELIAAVRSASAEPTTRATELTRRGGPLGASPEKVTPFADLPDTERRLLLELEQRLKHEKEE